MAKLKLNKLTKLNQSPLKTSKKKKRGKYSTKLTFEKVDWEKVEKIFAKDRTLIIKLWEERKEKEPRTREILTLLAGGAVLGLSLVFPTLPMAIAPFLIDSSKYNRRGIRHALKRLEKQKLVEVVDEDGQIVVRITEEGRVRALRYKLEEMTVKKPKIWDKKWRIVIFDIPEKAKRMREIFRHHLKTMGFYMLQKSVWVHPYPCFNEIEFLRQVYNVGINATYIVAEKIEGAEDLKQHFRLG